MPTWTAEREALAKKLWAEGASATIIGNRLGVTRNAVIGKVHRLGLTGRPTVKRAAMPRWAAKRRQVHSAAIKSAWASGSFERRRSALTGLPIDGPKTPAEPLPPPSVTDVPRKALADLANNDCRWPVTINIGTPDERHMFCAEPQTPGSSYCECHARRAHVHTQPKPSAWQEQHVRVGPRTFVVA